MEMEHVTKAFLAASFNSTTPDQISIARELIDNLGEEKVFEIFDELVNAPDNFENDLYCKSDFDFYWIATKLIEMDKAEIGKDEIAYPSCDYVTGFIYAPCRIISSELNSILGVFSETTTIYKNGTIFGSKGYVDITFDSISAYNKFIWAGCHRYFGLTGSSLWKLIPNMSDPDFNENKLKFELHYMDMNANASKMYNDFKELADGIKEYATCQDFADKKIYKADTIDDAFSSYMKTSTSEEKTDEKTNVKTEKE